MPENGMPFTHQLFITEIIGFVAINGWDIRFGRRFIQITTFIIMCCLKWGELIEGRILIDTVENTINDKTMVPPTCVVLKIVGMFLNTIFVFTDNQGYKATGIGARKWIIPFFQMSKPCFGKPKVRGGSHSNFR